LFSIIQAAGWPIWPLILCSVVALALIIERLYHLRPSQVAPPKLLDEVVGVTRASLPAADVVNKLEDNSVLGRVLAIGIRAVVAEPRIAEAGLRQAFEGAGRAAVHTLERYLNTLGTIASAAPLLGLLGTVIGMIEIFGSQAPGTASGGNPQQLAQGISIALYNTAFGLMIAIPALMFHRHFRRRVEEFELQLELAAERMVPHLMRFAVRSAPLPPAAAPQPAVPVTAA
jgi:biopolymer transport protein ExbB